VPSLPPHARPWNWLLPPLLAVVVVVLDVVLQSRVWPVPILGLLDEPAHFATAWLVLRALTPRNTPSWLWGAALVASVAIDVDHVPLYLTDGHFAVQGGRPPTHSLSLAALLAMVGLAGSAMRWELGAATGVLLHLVRDAATGPGVPLLWPVSDAAVLVPYPAYLGTVAVLALVAVARGRPGARTTPTAASAPDTAPDEPGRPRT
jgi:inner membrane protein